MNAPSVSSVCLGYDEVLQRVARFAPVSCKACWEATVPQCDVVARIQEDDTEVDVWTCAGVARRTGAMEFREDMNDKNYENWDSIVCWFSVIWMVSTSGRLYECRDASIDGASPPK